MTKELDGSQETDQSLSMRTALPMTICFLCLFLLFINITIFKFIGMNKPLGLIFIISGLLFGISLVFELHAKRRKRFNDI